MSRPSGGFLRCFPAWLGLLLLVCVLAAQGGQDAASKDASSDPLLRAMREELERSKAQLKMENVPAPYYIEYRVWDVDQYDADAAFGALRQDQRTHVRTLRVLVRVGDYKQDSYFGPGIGIANYAPVDDDPVSLRWQLWIATDQAYKAASEALAAKKAALREFTSEQPFDDFSHEPPVESLEPLARLDFDPKPWKDALQKATAAFRSDPKIQFLTAQARFRAVNQYFLNTEGTVTRHGYAVYSLSTVGSTQADDGMRLERSPDFTTASPKELPTPEQFVSETAKMVATLKDLREAPVVEEDYRGPVLFSSDAATDIFSGMIARNVLGNRPRPGDAARTIGEFASNYKSRVLPAFLSVFDDPTMKTFNGKSLIGSYDTDDEGVRAKKITVVEDGQLINYLLGRQPIRDFPESNGHGRAAPSQVAFPSIGNLIVEPKQSFSPAELKQKLIELCRQEGLPYAYYAETVAPPAYNPRLLYRVYEKDGHEELVRGAVFNELDIRALRNDLVAAGNDPLVSNRSTLIPTTVIAPSILFDQVEVKRTDAKNAKLPEYPPPALATSH